MKRTVSVLTSLAICGMLLVAGQGQTSAVGQDEKKIEMVAVKLKDLVEKHIPAQKGKVVIVDLWGFFCPPCKKEFPNLVRLHHAHAKDGLVCMSVSLDYSDLLKRKSLEFLTEKKAVITNYWLEEGIQGAQAQWKFDTVPTVIVYGRDGKIAQVFNNDDESKAPFTYKDVELLVKKLLEQK